MQNLTFFGSDIYSATVLSNLISNKNSLPFSKISVVTDDISGGSPVQKVASSANLPYTFYPTLPNDSQVGLCASFDHLLPQDTIALFKGNLYNLHPSLLPQYRNVSPVQYALALGDQITGITLFRISKGIDNGEIIAQARLEIDPSDATLLLTKKLFTLGADMFINSATQNFPPLSKSLIPTYDHLVFTKRLTKDFGFIEWTILRQLINNKSNIELSISKNPFLQIRQTLHIKSDVLSDLYKALTPWPGIWSLVPTQKGELRINIESLNPKLMLKIAGKPKAISFQDFSKYYLD